MFFPSSRYFLTIFLLLLLPVLLEAQQKMDEEQGNLEGLIN